MILSLLVLISLRVFDLKLNRMFRVLSSLTGGLLSEFSRLWLIHRWVMYGVLLGCRRRLNLLGCGGCGRLSGIM